MKKVVTLLLVLAMTVGLFTGCGSSNKGGNADNTPAAPSGTETDSEAIPEGSAADIKVGIIYIGDENEGYTAAHMEGIKVMATSLGLSSDQVIEKTHIGEDESAYDAIVDLAEQGCNIVFANSFGHEDYMIQAAQEFTDVQFAHATGFQAASSGLPNMHNYFTAVYESRYVSGVVAGLKLNDMITKGEITAEEAKMGYVGAYPYAEVVSGFTAFYLGAKSVCPSVTMEVQYTNSWADMTAENEVAKQLIANGAKLISQHADTTGAPTAAEDAKVPVVGYNVDMTLVAPNTALTSATINWGPYYTYAVKSVIDGTAIAADWSKGYVDGAVAISPINESVAAEGTADKVAEVEAALKAGTLKVFDTSTFTVNGSTLEELIASNADYEKYSANVSDGYFHESEVISSPAFGIIIDGITEK
ncbi:BMP family ABC transporter substrate-binding protein [Anaerocolumna cellulosilytica]|uniref:BMP family ABC transporter substrate-binding protein n=1 Tax=Anaerocolumna cellulosilytica TaxID=433286 RepID=A0A6S6QZ66_9FIRM|nr:BMP family ABC transporter substrate-binding protein [Anaerocolumna cellulosilytica]MBB5197738.1 basic membrane protein A [Anaerocolumna cellulosilytica]BCJ96493.1 BMP family ABC transporter substrate-binding protein [Anaerocolumna cellulosilytica]